MNGHARHLLSGILLLAVVSFQQFAVAQKNVPGGSSTYNSQNSPKPFARGVSDLGAIASFSVPASFQADQHTEGAISYAYTWKHTKDKDVSLSVSWRGPRLPETFGKTVNELMSKKPHALTQEEIRSLRSILRQQSDPDAFKVTSAETKDVGGQRVIAVNGLWKEWNLNESTIYVKSDSNGTVFQQVSFIAPASKFASYQKDGQAALDSLRLKDRRFPGL